MRPRHGRKEPRRIITGCDFHTRFQQIAMLDTATGEAQSFYAALAGPARVGMEASGYARWFERMLGAGDAAETRAARVRRQQTAAQFDPELRRDYLRLMFRRGKAVPAGRDRENEGAPCLPFQKGSSEKQLWSERDNRIDGWWSLLHRRIARGRVMVRNGKTILIRDEASLYAVFVPVPF